MAEGSPPTSEATRSAPLWGRLCGTQGAQLSSLWVVARAGQLRGLSPHPYLLCPPTYSKPVGLPPQRALSVEDVGAPSLARPVGRLVEAFPDGTSQLQLQCTPGGNFGFCVATGNGRRDSGRCLYMWGEGRAFLVLGCLIWGQTQQCSGITPNNARRLLGVGAGARMSFLLGFDSPTLGQKLGGGTEAVTW